MKNYCNLRNWVAVGLLALATGTAWAQCVDMSTLDDGNKRFINYDAGFVRDSINPRNQEVIKLYGWGSAEVDKNGKIIDHNPPYTSPAGHPRQVLMTTEGTDNLCPELSVLPPGLTTSARLMNDGYQTSDSAKGEWLAFIVSVDADNPILLINYAAVIEDPKHLSVVKNNPSSGQPFCGYYVMDAETGELYGGLRHYVSQPSTIQGWKSFENKERNNITTYWKDWSKTGLDLSKFAGKKVFVILENYDCAVSDISNPKNIIMCPDHHESHMYAHVTCAPKELVFRKDCEGEEDSIFITAPEGFSYRWYEKKDKETTLSTDRELKMKAADEDAVYVCELTNHVGTFELEQAVDAAEIIVDDDVEVDFGKTYTWPRSGETIKMTGDYEYIEHYTGTDLDYYSKSCAKKIYRIHVQASELDCPGQFSVKDSICGDAKGFNVAFHYDEKVDKTDPENPVSIRPSVISFKVNFSDNWNNQEGETIQIDDNTSIIKKGYGDITQAIKVDGIAMDSVINIPMPLDSVFYDITGEWVYAYPRPDDYSMTLTVINSCGQEETREVPFTVLYPSNIIYQRWNDILAVKNEHFNGGNPIATVRWFRNKQEVIGRGEHHSYIHSGDFSSDKNEKLNSNDSFYAELTRSTDGKTFCTCRFRPTDLGRDEKPEFKGEFNLAPRRNDNRQVEVISTTSGQYTLYDLTGRPLQNGQYGEQYGAPDIVIDATVTRGTYLLFFRSDEGEQVTKKWIVK